MSLNPGGSRLVAEDTNVLARQPLRSRSGASGAGECHWHSRSTPSRSQPRKKPQPLAETLFLVTHTSESLHLIVQEGKRWRVILDPMYREYKLQIQSRD